MKYFKRYKNGLRAFHGMDNYSIIQKRFKIFDSGYDFKLLLNFMHILMSFVWVCIKH